MEEIDAAGEWWLPTRPERKVSGRLTYTVESGARLSLIGSLRDWHEEGREVRPGVVAFGEDDLDRAGAYGRLHGQVESKAYTLDGCFRTRLNRNLFGGLPAEEIRANRVFRGAWYEEDEVIVGHRLSTRLLHLVYWVHESGLGEEWRWPDRSNEAADAGQPVATLTAHSLPRKHIALTDGATIRIDQTIGLEGDQVASRTIRQDFVLTVELPTSSPLEDLMVLLSDAHDVISIGLNRTACFESITLYDEALAEGEGDRRRLVPVDFLAQWSDRDGWREPKLLTARDMLFSLDDLGGPDGFQSLLEATARFRSEARRVTATRNGKAMFPSDRLMNRAAALESFDRARTAAKGSHFRTRINRCATLAGSPFEQLVKDVSSWVTLFKDRRNLQAHHLERSPEEDGYVDLVMADCAYFLFVLCLLREADAPDKVFDLVQQNSEFHWLANQVPAVLSAGSPASTS